jgi:hypothetical protein
MIAMKLSLLIGLFAFLVLIGSVGATDFATYAPIVDYNCYSGENYNASIITCTRATVADYNNTISVGDDVFVYNTDLKGIFVFDNDIGGGSVVSAQFCGYVNYGFCDQIGNTYLPCSIGDINASHIIVPEDSLNASYWNSTAIGDVKVFQQGYPPANPHSVPFAYICINVTDWVHDDIADGRNRTAIRLSPTGHDNSLNANFLRMPSSTAISNRPYLQIGYSSTANYNNAYPLWDANCYSGGNYDYGFVNCSTSGNPEQGGAYANTISPGNDVYAFYTDERGLFVFNTSLPAGANVTNASFCGYVDMGFCNQICNTCLPCAVGDINATQFIPSSLSNPSISDYNETAISGSKIFLPAQTSPVGVPYAYVCIDITDWLQNNTANNRSETGVRLAITQYPLVNQANFFRMPSHSFADPLKRPYIYYEWEEASPEPEPGQLTGMALTLSDAGTGLGGFLDAINAPVVQFILALGFVGGILIVVFGFVKAIGMLGNLTGEAGEL